MNNPLSRFADAPECYRRVVEWATECKRLASLLAASREYCERGHRVDDACRIGSYDAIPEAEFCSACKRGREAYRKVKALRPRVAGLRRRLIAKYGGTP